MTDRNFLSLHAASAINHVLQAYNSFYIVKLDERGESIFLMTLQNNEKQYILSHYILYSFETAKHLCENTLSLKLIIV